MRGAKRGAFLALIFLVTLFSGVEVGGREVEKIIEEVGGDLPFRLSGRYLVEDQQV